LPLYLDRKYTTLLGQRLERFSIKKESPFVATCRCMICGDSQKNKYKTRGYFYEKGQRINYKCHNCGASTSSAKLMQMFDTNLYDDYLLEVYRDRDTEIPDYVPQIEKAGKRRIDKFEPFKDLKKISQLDTNHPAKKYIQGRKIPSNMHWRMYWCSNFSEWIEQFEPDTFDKKNTEGRIVFPLISEGGYVFGANSRSINKNSQLRYVTTIFDTKYSKVFGLDQINRTKEIFVVEGPMDSLLISNSVAMVGADVDLEMIGSRSQLTVVLDNQPRNKEVLKHYEKLIHDDYKICIWPSHVKEKDVNDMHLTGMSLPDIKKMIVENTVRGLSAQIKYAEWKKI